MKSVYYYIFYSLLLISCTRTTVSNSNNNGSSTGTDTSTNHVLMNDTVPASIEILSGNNQTRAKGQSLPNTPTIVVKNKKGNPLNGISVTFRPCVACGFVYEDTTITNPNGLAESNWVLGSVTDSTQTLLVWVTNHSNLQVVFTAIAEDLKTANMTGTLNMIDSSALDLSISVGGAPDFPVLPYNTNLPFVINGMTINAGGTTADSLQLIINGHALSGFVNSNFNNYIEIIGGESKFYPVALPGGINSYSMHWDFQGSLINNNYSGSFVLVVNYSRKSSDPNSHEIYQSGYDRDGVFSTSLK
jgi:hypothetical protein